MSWSALHEACLLMAGQSDLSFGGAVIAAADAVVGGSNRTVNEAAIALALDFSGDTAMSAAAAFNYLLTPDAASKTLFGAFTAEPGGARSIMIDNAIVKGMQADDNWDAIHCLHIYAAHNADDALLNIKDPATFTAELTSAPPFEEDRGFTTDGTADFIDTTFNCSTDGDQDSIGWAFWSLTNQQDGVRNGQNDGTDSLSFAPRDSSDRMAYAVNHANANVSTTANGSVTSSIGFFYCNRSANNAVQAGKNGVQLGSDTDASTTPNNLTLKLGTQTGALFNATQFACSLVTTSRTEAQWLQIYNRLLIYMRAVGAA